MRHPLHTLAAAAAVAMLSACSASTEPQFHAEALASATTFEHIADSLAFAGADAAVSNAYRDLASIVRSDPGVSRVNISVDGTPAEYFATVQSLDQNYCPPGIFCDLVYRPPLNSVVAWQRTDPRRIVQLTVGGDFLSGAPGLPLAVETRSPARGTLIFLDGTGGVFTGDVPLSMSRTPTDERCAAPDRDGFNTATRLDPPALVCYRVEFGASFNGAVQPASVALRRNTASGAHTIDMAWQAVPGTFLGASGCNTCGPDFPGFRPPISILGNSTLLRPALSATVNGRDVTLSFSVRNVTPAAVLLEFKSGQQYDFVVRSATSNALLWQWSADKAFTQALSSRTLAPGETAVFTEQWRAPVGGSYSADAMLTSSSHRAMATTYFNVP